MARGSAASDRARGAAGLIRSVAPATPRPTVVATALPKPGAPPAYTELDALPASITDAPIEVEETDDTYDGHVAVFQPGDEAYAYVGQVLPRATGDGWNVPAVRRVVGSVDDAIAAAAQMSTDVASGNYYGGRVTAPAAVGVFDAGTGAYALGTLFWNDANNGDATNVPLAVGAGVYRASPQLVAVVSDEAIARFDRN